MLQDFLICVNAVIPSAIYLAIGIALKVFHIVNDEEVKRFTHITFMALYPFLMFDNLYGKNIGQHMNWYLILFVMCFLAFEILSSALFVFKIEKSNYNRGAMIQAMFRSNIVLMGLPIAINLFGKGNVTSVAVVLMFIVPAYNVVAVILFEKLRGGSANALSIIKGIITNPLIVGGIIACIVMGLRLEVPGVLYQTIVSLSDATTPIAMILLGASLSLDGFSDDRPKVVLCSFVKLVVFPAIAIGAAVWLGFRDVELIAIILMVATPTALASFAMSSSMGGNGRLSAEVVVATSIAACFTIPVWLFVLKTGGFF